LLDDRRIRIREAQKHMDRYYGSRSRSTTLDWKRRTDLDGGEDDGGVGVGEPRGDPLTDGLRLPVILRGVVRQRVQDEHLQQGNQYIHIRILYISPGKGKLLPVLQIPITWMRIRIRLIILVRIRILIFI
jgi:hypothetical protein